MENKALIVFARSPKSGQVKSRLTSLITPREAANIYRAFLKDSLKQFASLGVAVRLYMSDEKELDFPVYGATILRQHGDDLGKRMQHAFTETAETGYEQIVIIGTDHPTLPDAYIQSAFDALLNIPTVSIGPTEDGGYYLLGMNPYTHGLFDGMVYSRSDVYRLTLERAYHSGTNIVELPEWYDVDTPDDLKRLIADERLVPPNTLKILKQLKIKYNL